MRRLLTSRASPAGRQSWTSTAGPGPSPWQWPGTPDGLSARRSCPRPWRTPGRTRRETASKTRSSSWATRGTWPGASPGSTCGPMWWWWTRPGRGWVRRWPGPSPAWGRSGWCMSPATPEPWHGMSGGSRRRDMPPSGLRRWICFRGRGMWRRLFA